MSALPPKADIENQPSMSASKGKPDMLRGPPQPDLKWMQGQVGSLKWYHTQRWRRRAALQLKLEPLCAICLQNGQVVPATEADHIVPHKGNERAFWYGELQVRILSPERQTKEEKRGYRTDIGIDGWPIDPRHPANR
jgi:hypothetical protein